MRETVLAVADATQISNIFVASPKIADSNKFCAVAEQSIFKNTYLYET